jgi:predicted nucleic acid-binding protein
MMEDVVVDSSVAVKWFVVEPYSAEARSILDGYRSGEVTLLAPDLIYAEFGNIIWKKHQFQGLAERDAALIIGAFQKLTLSLTSSAVLLEQAYHLAVTHHRTVYDAMYLALSLRERCRYVTADEKLVNSVGTAFPNAIWIGNWT